MSINILKVNIWWRTGNVFNVLI